uniref:Uncharacterized protein n=1 Tax=Anguilla anguilla TaxID=7936 RepID=A0A0E9PTH9_ANGAN
MLMNAQLPQLATDDSTSTTQGLPFFCKIMIFYLIFLPLLFCIRLLPAYEQNVFTHPPACNQAPRTHLMS